MRKCMFLVGMLFLTLPMFGQEAVKKVVPELSQWKDELPDVVFLSANFEKEEVVRRIAERHGFNWHHLANDDQFIRLMGQNGFPMTVVVDKEGIVRSIVHGTNVVKRAALRQKIEEYRQK